MGPVACKLSTYQSPAPQRCAGCKKPLHLHTPVPLYQQMGAQYSLVHRVTLMLGPSMPALALHSGVLGWQQIHLLCQHSVPMTRRFFSLVRILQTVALTCMLLMPKQA